MGKIWIVLLSGGAAVILFLLFLFVGQRDEQSTKPAAAETSKTVETAKATTAVKETAKNVEKGKPTLKKKDKRPKRKMSAEEKNEYMKSHTFDFSKSSEEKIEVLETYADFGDPGIVEFLNKALDDKDPEVRLKAIEILSDMEQGVIPQSEIITLIDKAVLDDKDDIRLAAIEIISQIEIKGAQEVLAKAIDDKAEDVRSAAFDGLDYQDPEGKNMVLSKGINSSFKDVRESVINNITMNASHDGVNILIEGLKSDDKDFKSEVKETLEFLIDQKFESYEEAKKWWEGNRDRYDEDLFEKDEK